MNHVALAEANIEINGVLTPELALANAGDNKVIVRVGLGPNPQRIVFDASDGINDPQSVALGNVNYDGIPDLVVANSGDNNVLVFPGLPGGLFGPEINGGHGFQAGSDPVDVTINDFNDEIIVTNKDSNSISILQNQGSGANWNESVASTIQDVGLAPVKTALYDLNNDGQPDLFVCNSESNTVSMYTGQPGGTFDTANPTIYNVGVNPNDLLIGQFDDRPVLDLITLNSGSNDLTFIGGVFTSRPTIQSYSSGGISPDAAMALAVDPSHSPVMDLVVANGGDGHVVLLRAANEGMQLAAVITQPDLPVPTGLAPATSSSDGLDFFAASAGQDAAQLLHFDLGTVSIFLASPLSESGSQGELDDELTAELMQFGESGLELIAVFWAGSPDTAAINGEWGLREPSMITALYSPPTEGQGTDATSPTSEVVNNPRSPQAPLPDLSKVVSSMWVRFVSGIDAALTEPQRLTSNVVAARDTSEAGDERPIEGFARLDPTAFRPARATPMSTTTPELLVDEALRLFWSEGRPGDPSQPAEFDHRSDSPRGVEGIDSPTLEGPLEAVPLVSSALLLSCRLILKASPPRPPFVSRRGPGRRGFFGLGDARLRRGQPDRG